ncbi:MAG TPA: molybdopterin cofactor-binding domain-containing protein, partial [Isosphaeraceae bacterium]|nr:molybdopterin cofactor-binding domain-containing protein [Isosphaeraceae bacterium]
MSLADLDRAELEAERYELFEGPDRPVLLDRREFLKRVGGGLVVLCLMTREAPARQESGRRGRSRGGSTPREISAWIQIDGGGRVSACTGKVEVGQNIRTSLSQAVADELGMAPESITLVMGDTEKTPFDMGTFGSRTTPSMAPQLRRAAAAAREVLSKMAAQRWQVDPDQVEIRDGQAVERGKESTVGLGELTRGEPILEVITDETAVTPAPEWNVAGKSVAKLNGRDFVTGKHRYASDQSRPGLLHGKVLRPPALGAELTGLDASKAEAMDGVVVVRDGAFVGVAAPDEATALKALSALKAEWSKGTETGSDADLFDRLKESVGQDPRGRGAGDRGAVEQALDAADVKVSSRYTVAYIAHASLEPRAALAEWEGDRLTVWTGTQRPFGVRGELAQAFDVPESNVRVIVPDTGAGYGGKHTGEAAVEAARLAKAARRPVKLVWSRPEEFTWAYFRPAGVIEAAAGASKDGTLTAWSFENINSGGSGIEPPYRVQNRHVAFRPARSPLRQGSYRALASSANHFARESLMDELAKELQMDPLEFRLRNLEDQRVRAVLEAAAKQFGWGKNP